jgi:hypothetical protein
MPSSFYKQQHFPIEGIYLPAQKRAAIAAALFVIVD